MLKTPSRFPIANDPLGEVLHQLRLDGSLYCRSRLLGDWSLSMPILDSKMMFHVITSGQAWLTIKGQDPKLLKQGSLVLVPHGLGHTLSSDPKLESTPLFESNIHKVSDRYETLDIGDITGMENIESIKKTGGMESKESIEKAGGMENHNELTELTCGVVSFDQFAGKQLIQSLPPLILLESLEQSKARWLNASLDFIAEESRQLKPGGETVITHLADILVIQLIRHWLDTSEEANQGWLGALKDKHISIALSAIHHHPHKNWTVDSLAKECGMSRSSFSAHFTLLVGNTVKHYLTQWRMSLAYQRLKKHNEPLITLAEALGYRSEAAFSRAFKRVMGFSPSQVDKH